MPQEPVQIPALFGTEEKAIQCVAKYLDFLNADPRNEETPNRVRFLNDMLKGLPGGHAAFNSDDSKFGEASNFIRMLTDTSNGERNFPLPSHSHAQIVKVMHPALKRDVYQLHFGEMTISDFKRTGQMHQNTVYIRLSSEQRLDLIKNERAGDYARPAVPVPQQQPVQRSKKRFNLLRFFTLNRQDVYIQLDNQAIAQRNAAVNEFANKALQATRSLSPLLPK